MILKSTFAVFATTSTFLIATPVLAAGDLPLKLNQRQAAEVYQTVRPLLAIGGATCPTEQMVKEGIVTGGSSPSGGSQTTTIIFNSGEKVVINRTWASSVGKKLMISAKIGCS